jgi:branched-chain amino acid transport system ATP-binding protein
MSSISPVLGTEDAGARTGSEAVLALRGLGLRIGGARIVDDVSLTVAAGELVGVIGPNGAGKTSLLNLVSGTLFPTSGSIIAFGDDITRQAPHRRARRGIARTFQTSYLLLGLTVLENVRLAVQAESVRGLGRLRIVGPRDPTIARAAAALERVGLADRRDDLAGSLSHGERRKLEIAMVVATHARLVLFDEPMAGVHADDVGPLTELIRAVHRADGVTVLMVEHHLNVVLGLADRVAVMHHGALLALDTPERVMADERVRTAYVGEPL